MGNHLTQCIELANSAASVLSQDGKNSTAASFIGPDTLKKLNVNEEAITEGIKALSELIIKPNIVKPSPAAKKPKEFHNFGESGSGFRAPNADAIQDFHKIREYCLQNGQLFEDKSFPAIGASLFYSSRKGNEFKWMRPKELVDDPKFILEGASRFDVCQGELGDCWLLASVANLTLNEKLFKRVVPHDQSFGSDYAGIFHFRFWQYGKWIDICVDDRLPTMNGKLVLMHSKDKNEFWSALLEKAYAKLHGSYEALKGGTVTEALTDFTGGLTEFYEIQSDECPANLLQIMIKAFERSSFMGCSIDTSDASQMESELPNGLIRGHAYSITAVRCVELKTSRVQGKIPLIRIRNPWGNEAEWKGAWGDGSREWSLVSEDEKKRLELTFDHDGEFWMTFQDFKANFTKLEICHLEPEPATDGPNANKKVWSEVQFEGEWVAGVTAGGCRNHIATFATNPQYIIELKDHDEDDEDDLCTLIVGLMQKNRRAKRKMGLDSLTIGFAVYAIKDGLFSYGDEPAAVRGYARRQLLPTEFFKYNASVARSPTFINLREVSSRMRLPPGQYCIIPSTFDPNEEGEFLLRIFTERPPSNAEENDDEVGYCPEDIDQQNVIAIDDSKDKVNEEDIIRREVKPPSPGPGEGFDVQNITRYIEIFDTVMNGLRFVLTNCVQSEETQENVQQSQGTRVLSNKTADFFSKIAGEDMEVDAAELQEILNHALKKEFKFDGFSLDTCRSMIALLDDDRSGKLGLDEFTSLWTKIRHWCDVFKCHDKDSSGTINTAELRAALHETGLSVNRSILILIVHRYGDLCGKKHDHSVKHERYLSFDNFIHVCLKLQHSIDLWNGQNSDSTTHLVGKSLAPGASFTLDEWVEKVMYC